MTNTAIIATLLITILLALLTAGMLALLAIYVTGAYRRAAQQLSAWAAYNGYRIVDSDRRYVSKGPFTWTSSRSQIVYHVTVQDASGNFHRGWVRCGSFLLGAWQDQVNVIWEN